jgi:hypothetical protein
MELEVGTRVKVNEGAGLDSGREGIIVHHSCLPLNGRGILNIGEGHYKPFDSSREAVILDDNDKMFTMFWGCLSVIN